MDRFQDTPGYKDKVQDTPGFKDRVQDTPDTRIGFKILPVQG